MFSPALSRSISSNLKVSWTRKFQKLLWLDEVVLVCIGQGNLKGESILVAILQRQVSVLSDSRFLVAKPAKQC